MEEKDIWADAFNAKRILESMRIDVETAEAGLHREIARLYRAGIPKVQLARRLGYSRPTINKILAEQGVKN